jgi:hypothetical protein
MGKGGKGRKNFRIVRLWRWSLAENRNPHFLRVIDVIIDAYQPCHTVVVSFSIFLRKSNIQVRQENYGVSTSDYYVPLWLCLHHPRASQSPRSCRQYVFWDYQNTRVERWTMWSVTWSFCDMVFWTSTRTPELNVELNNIWCSGLGAPLAVWPNLFKLRLARSWYFLPRTAEFHRSACSTYYLSSYQELQVSDGYLLLNSV